MHRKFITLIIATAIAVTGFSAPARAGSRDVARALAGFAALAIIGAAINDSRNRQPDVSRNHTKPVSRTPTHRRHGYVNPRPLPRHVARTVLPRSCLRSFDAGRGTDAHILGRDCMKRTYGFTKNLPNACAQRVWSPKGVRRGFNVQCLKTNGYRISRN